MFFGILIFSGCPGLFALEFILEFQDDQCKFFGVSDVSQEDLFAVIRVNDKMSVVEDLRADGGTDLDVLDLGKGDLDPSM